MDAKQGALLTIVVLGGIGLLAVSCSDSDEQEEHGQSHVEESHSLTAEHDSVADEQAPSASDEAGEQEHAAGAEHGETQLDVSQIQAADACVGFGPQTPRDIDSKGGENPYRFTLAPGANRMNLCNIHLHKNAEHKATAFNIYAGDGDGHGYNSGYQCRISRALSEAELAPTREAICEGEHGGLQPGDTIEVHWVHSSCDVTPGPGLGSCLSESCANPDLRVETQVFTLVNDPDALDFNDLDYDGNMINGYHQAKGLPTNTGRPVEFLGSTTGTKYSDLQCSPLQVTWSVRPQCAKVNINSVGEWCKDNAFDEDHAHGVRKLVRNPKLLSNIE